MNGELDVAMLCGFVRVCKWAAISQPVSQSVSQSVHTRVMREGSFPKTTSSPSSSAVLIESKINWRQANQSVGQSVVVEIDCGRHEWCEVEKKS